MGMIRNHDWKELSKEFSEAPFPSICIDGFLEDGEAEKIAQSYPGFADAQKFGLEFAKVNERGKVQITDDAYFPEPVGQLAETLASPKFLKDLETLSGISDLIWDPEFGGGGMHLTRTRGHLDVHVDFNYSEELQLHRRINLLLYLNEDWQDEWGGNLELWNKDVKNCFASILPLINRCVIFATSDRSYHGVQSVTGPENLTRNSFAVYYYTAQPPEGWTGEKHSTIFRARPEEKLKKYILMPSETIQENEFFQKLNRLKNRLLHK